MKKPLPICVRFHTTPAGNRVMMLTCAETGRPLDCQTGIKTEYDAESNSYIVDSTLAVPAEEVGEREPMVAYESVDDPEDVADMHYEDEDLPYGRIVGFRRK